MTFIEDPTTMEQSLRNELPEASAIEFITLSEKKKSLSFPKKFPGSSASKPQDPPIHVLPLKETYFLHENVVAPPLPPPQSMSPYHVIPPIIETSVMHEVDLTPYHLNMMRSQSVDSFDDMHQTKMEIPG
jgi:hypothetical protein